MNTKLLSGLSLLAVSVAMTFAADTIDEKQFQKHMKSVGKASKDFKGNFESKNAAAIEKDAATVADAYKAMEGFWKAKHADDAAKWSDDSALAATATVTAAKAGDWDKVKSNWGGVGKNCKSCHEKYREKLPDGGYKIK